MSASTGPNIGEFNAIWAPSNQPKRKAVNLAVESHRKDGAAIVVRCAVITISDTRTEADDKSGKLIKDLLEDTGHTVGFYKVVPDEADQIRHLLV
ncbi:MAG: molybdopterin-binding protein, partial [Candidatus Latescibacteria bacterium]|nr:molybdopterin-binding protein [Candidatus Latescibacterota bacterium]